MADRMPGMIGAARAGPKRVLRTGLALVHENEIVYPAAGSAAQAVQAIDDTRGAVQIFFPVQIEIRAVGTDSRPAGTDAHSADALARETAQALGPD